MNRTETREYNIYLKETTWRQSRKRGRSGGGESHPCYARRGPGYVGTLHHHHTERTLLLSFFSLEKNFFFFLACRIFFSFLGSLEKNPSPPFFFLGWRRKSFSSYFQRVLLKKIRVEKLYQRRQVQARASKQALASPLSRDSTVITADVLHKQARAIKHWPLSALQGPACHYR